MFQIRQLFSHITAKDTFIYLFNFSLEGCLATLIMKALVLFKSWSPQYILEVTSCFLVLLTFNICFINCPTPVTKKLFSRLAGEFYKQINKEDRYEATRNETILSIAQWIMDNPSATQVKYQK